MKTKKLTKKAAKETLKQHPEMLYAEMPKEYKELFPVVTVKVASKYFGLHFTTDHNGKMDGFESVSTTCKASDKCKNKIQAAFRLVMGSDFVLETATRDDIKTARKLLNEYIKKNPTATNASVCGFCFSDRQQDYMTSMKTPLERNHDILNGGVIHSDWLPILNDLYFRVESFGDFSSIYAVINILNLIRKNKNTFFGVWTKNPIFFHKVFNGGRNEKPENCNIIYSSQFVNKATRIPEKYRYFIDKTFTVYTKKYMKEKNITCNCGARACLTCLNCYTKNEIKNIREEIK